MIIAAQFSLMSQHYVAYLGHCPDFLFYVIIGIYFVGSLFVVGLAAADIRDELRELAKTKEKLK